MSRFIGKVKGEFVITQEVIADSLEEANKKLQSNLGDIIECIAESNLEVSDVMETD